MAALTTDLSTGGGERPCFSVCSYFTACRLCYLHLSIVTTTAAFFCLLRIDAFVNALCGRRPI